MKKPIAIFLFCILSIGQIYSQNNPYIYSINIIPPNPTTNNSIQIVTKTIVYGMGKKLWYSYTKKNDTFNLAGCFYNSGITDPAYYSDTTNIGKLDTGNYFISYIGKASYIITSCTILYDSSIMTKSFIVKEANGIENDNLNSFPFSIFPNPTTSFIKIKQDELNKKCDLELINCLGRGCK